MTATVTPGSLTFQASAALAPYRRVKFHTSGKLEYAGASDFGLGVLDERALAADAYVAVRPYHDPGSFRVVAAGAINRGASVYAAANGKVAATGTVLLGTAVTAAAADGDELEVLPAVGRIVS
jgi:hypothetical protein